MFFLTCEGVPGWQLTLIVPTHKSLSRARAALRPFGVRSVFFFYPLSSLRDCIGRRRDLFSRHSTNVAFARFFRSCVLFVLLFSSSSSSVRERLQNSSSMAKKNNNNNNNNNNASLKLSGVPRPGEAIRAVLLERVKLDSNADATIRFQLVQKRVSGGTRGKGPTTTTKKGSRSSRGIERGRARFSVLLRRSIW